MTLDKHNASHSKHRHVERDEDSDTTPLTKDSNHKELHDKINQLEESTKDIATKLNEFHDREMRRVLMQPCVLVIAMIIVVACYLLFPLALIGIALICLMLAWAFPVLAIPLWSSIILLIVHLAHTLSTDVDNWLSGPLFSVSMARK